MDLKQSDLIIHVISKIKRRSDVYLENKLAEAGLKGLVASHGAILSALYANSGMLRLTDIAEIIERKKPTVTVLVDRLVKMGIVSRQPSQDDARITNIMLTPRGYEIKDTLNLIGSDLLAKAFKGLSPGEREACAELLFRIHSNF